LPGKKKRGLPSVPVLTVFLFVVSFLTYFNTLNNEYALDDLIINQNAYIAKGVEAIPDLLSSPYLEGFRMANNDADTAAFNDLYRPLSLVTFAAEYQLLGPSSRTSHLINILLFSGCVLLLFLFLNMLFEGKRTGTAFLAALLFAIHPIHTEVVVNIKSRDELLCFALAFCSLLSFIKYSISGKSQWLVSGILCYFLSLISKETSISFLAVFPLVFFFYLNEQKKRSLYITVASALTAGIYLFIRFYVLKTHHANNSAALEFIDNQLVGAPSSAQKIATAILVLGYYIKLLFVPHPLICSYGFSSIPFVNFAIIKVVISLAAYVGIIFLGVSRLLKKNKDPFAFGILFFLITMVLFSNLVLLIGALMAERFLFFGSAGFCLVVALFVWRWLTGNDSTGQIAVAPSRKWYPVAIVSLVLVFLTIHRNAEWRDNLTLATSDVQKSPDNARLWYYLGYETAIAGFSAIINDTLKGVAIRDGVSYFQKALAIYPGYEKAHNDIGNLFLKLLKYDSAEAHLRQAMLLNPKNPVPISDLGGIYFAKGQLAQAIEMAEKALLITPRNFGIMNNLAICYISYKSYDSAISISKRVLALHPGDKLALDNIAIATKELQKNDSVRQEARN
jgi:tetratricopeptide (TPR) repeat protein